MKKVQFLTVLSSLVCLTMPVWAESGAKQIGSADSGPFKSADGTSQFRKSQEMLRHLRNQARIAAQGLNGPLTPAIQSQDVGNVAVIVDNGTILIPTKPATPFDLTPPFAIRWTPNGASAFDAASTATALDGTLGGNLGLGDDDATAVEAIDSGTFPGFPYLGTTYSTEDIFVGSDGHITMGAPEASSASRDAGRFVGGPPRLGIFFNDLDPTAAGAVHADVRTDRVVITWNGVPEFGIANSNTFQAVLFASGAIDFVYSNIDAIFAMVGLAEGGGAGPFTEPNLSSDLPLVNVPVGAVFEEFSPAIAIQQMDVIALAREFYRTHGDDFDFLTMFADEVVDIGGGAFAFHLGLHSDTEGLGFFLGNSSVFDACGVVGLAPGCELESLLNMNRIGLYWPDQRKLVDPPIRKFRFFCFNVAGQIVPCGATFGGPPGADQLSLRARWAGTFNGDFGSHGSYTLGLNSGMSIMAQEAGHRWLAFPLVITPSFTLSTALLGRSRAHWSFFFDVTVPPEQFENQDGDPRASSAEGNAIADLGPDPRCPGAGRRLFQTRPNELIDGYTALDQYFIGLRTPGQVPPFWYIGSPSVIFGGSPNASSSARDDVLICGTRVNRVLSDITDIGDVLFPTVPSNGTRDPLIGDEQDAGAGIGPTDDARCTNDRECVDVKTMAFILLVGSGTPASHSSTISQVDNFRRAWESYANGPAVGNRGARGVVGDANYIKKFDTSLNPVIH